MRENGSNGRVEGKNPEGLVKGPFEVIDFGGNNGVEIWNSDYADVQGAQIMCSAVDNVAAAAQGPNVFLLTSIVGAEISVWGNVRGYDSLLKLQYVRNMTGPMNYRVPFDQPYDNISIRARMMCGGRSGGPSDGSVSSATGYSCLVTLYIRPGSRRYY